MSAYVLALVGTGCVDGVELIGDEDDVRREATDGGATDGAAEDVSPSDAAHETDEGGAVEDVVPVDGDGVEAGPCTVHDAGTTTGWGTCEDLAALVVEAPMVTDDSGDGRVSPGEGADIAVLLRETAGLDFMWYPGVTFVVDDPRVSVGGEDWRYGMVACSAEEFHARLGVPADVPLGAVVTITARAAMLPDECPDANTLGIPVTIR